MKGPKYLMIEENPEDVNLLSFNVKRRGYDVTVVGVEDALRFNSVNKPNVVQVDGLYGMCFGLMYDMRRDNPDADYFVLSADHTILDDAERRGVRAFGRGSGLDALLEHIDNIRNNKYLKNDSNAELCTHSANGRN